MSDLSSKSTLGVKEAWPNEVESSQEVNALIYQQQQDMISKHE